MTYPLLILDDDQPILNALQETLKLEGYECFGTVHANDALTFLQKRKFSVVLTDQRMAEMPGTQFLKQVKVVQPWCTRVLLTGVLTSDMFLEAINEAEIFRCLPKPWMRQQLISVVKDAYHYFEKNWAHEKAVQSLLEVNQKLVDENVHLRMQK